MPSSQPQMTTIYARCRGEAPALPPGEFRMVDVKFFDVVVPPTLPMTVGQWVRVNKIVENQEYSPLVANNHCRTKWSGVEGPIIGVRTIERSLVEFVVKNETPRSLVSHAYVAIPWIEGVTTRLEWWRRALWTLVGWTIPQVRAVITEDNMVPHEETEENDGDNTPSNNAHVGEGDLNPGAMGAATHTEPEERTEENGWNTFETWGELWNENEEDDGQVDEGEDNSQIMF
ncbi:hypothetical protein C8Q79DRAFT_926221 [Trametes meyenii]|nr:hypothetical protein C8Q79DRAFT_926221 [Trametes meyenii]